MNIDENTSKNTLVEIINETFAELLDCMNLIKHADVTKTPTVVIKSLVTFYIINITKIFDENPRYYQSGICLRKLVEDDSELLEQYQSIKRRLRVDSLRIIRNKFFAHTEIELFYPEEFTSEDKESFLSAKSEILDNLDTSVISDLRRLIITTIVRKSDITLNYLDSPQDIEILLQKMSDENREEFIQLLTDVAT